MARYVLDLLEIDGTQVALAGGKGAALGALSRLEGVPVPPGFCVTTDAWRRLVAGAAGLDARLDQLARLAPDDRAALAAGAADIRRTLETTPLPDDLWAALAGPLTGLGDRTPCAVRSSATAEDLPTASFAGQHDSFLGIAGADALLRHLRRCWASLFSDRAVSYRRRNGVDHRAVQMAVVVQRLVDPRAAGVLFTADPVTAHRRITAVEAVLGLGEALVSGRGSADVYRVRDDAVLTRAVAVKRLASRPAPAGGTRREAVAPERQEQPALTDAEVIALARLGRRIEAHFGQPQDIEWCLSDAGWHVVQSRPITALFPIPVRPAPEDAEPHVYLSVGHQQMMTDAMKPLGLSFFRHITRGPMYEAGGRLFVDVAPTLTSPATRGSFLAMVGRSDPLVGDALQSLVDRGDFLRPPPEGAAVERPASGPLGEPPAPVETDPALVASLIEHSEASLAALRRDLGGKTGPALLDFILEDIQELKRLLFDPQSFAVILAGMEATWGLNDDLLAWLGEKNAADALAQSAPHNVTSEMGLALLDVADAIRPHPQVVAYLRAVRDDGFLDELPRLPGGEAARDALAGYLEKYGMRCPGEIDITRPRWSEQPTALLPLLLGHIERFEPGAAARRFEHGRQVAAARERELLERLRGLPDGERKADDVRRRILRLRTFIGYREYPKYALVRRTFAYKRALSGEARRLVEAGALEAADDIFFLTLPELREVVGTRRVDRQVLEERREAFRGHRALSPPRVFTSDGEILTGRHRRGDTPAGALVGLAVSAGLCEGRARIVADLALADLEAGDILVTRCTDPAWTPLFVAARAVVTEVGGLMTHGAVIAREYGLPAVVGVEGATRRIRDGQRIRVDGTNGTVELLS